MAAPNSNPEKVMTDISQQIDRLKYLRDKIHLEFFLSSLGV